VPNVVSDLLGAKFQANVLAAWPFEGTWPASTTERPPPQVEWASMEPTLGDINLERVIPLRRIA
jgi:hypothetical protein